MLRRLCLLVFCVTALSARAQDRENGHQGDPKEAVGWFERANAQMNLRTPGSAPFHMKVRFHAFPGIELLPPEKSEIITGDGVYEETWMSPNQWRREVTLGSYHAIETHSDRDRKMQASSDYEPSRVLMLMEALLNPISRRSLSPELQPHRLHWRIDHPSVQGHSFVRISTSDSISGHLNTGTAYVFLPEGILLQSNETDVVTTWGDDAVFVGKVVPRHISIQAGTVRDLLTADVEVESPEKLDPTAFDLTGGSAAPGMTLRPLHPYEVRTPELISYPVGGAGEQQSKPDMIARFVIDRHGAVRELEVIYARSGNGLGLPDGAGHLMDDTRQIKLSPPEIDKSPCELVSRVLWTGH